VQSRTSWKPVVMLRNESVQARGDSIFLKGEIMWGFFAVVAVGILKSKNGIIEDPQNVQHNAIMRNKSRKNNVRKSGNYGYQPDIVSSSLIDDGASVNSSGDSFSGGGGGFSGGGSSSSWDSSSSSSSSSSYSSSD
jgi:uncharacterized membrane protein YgcG